MHLRHSGWLRLAGGRQVRVEVLDRETNLDENLLVVDLNDGEISLLVG